MIVGRQLRAPSLIFVFQVIFDDLLTRSDYESRICILKQNSVECFRVRR